MALTHDELCQIACRFLQNNGFKVAFHDRFVAYVGTGEQPDAWAAGWNACRAAMLQAGNSPVIGIDLATGADKTVEVRYVAPPGYVMVPKEPTKEMIYAGWLHYMGTKNPSSKGTYKAMLAAATQEVK